LPVIARTLTLHENKEYISTRKLVDFFHARNRMKDTKAIYGKNVEI